MGNKACWKASDQSLQVENRNSQRSNRANSKNAGGIQSQMDIMGDSARTLEGTDARYGANKGTDQEVFTLQTNKDVDGHMIDSADTNTAYSRPVSQAAGLPKGKLVVPGKEKNDIDSDDDKGNMLNDLGSDGGSIDFEKMDDEDNEADKLFALGGNHATLNRVTKNFQIAQSRALNRVSTEDYLLSPVKRIEEEPLSSADAQAYEKALFYMYGACESLDEDENQHIIHNLLRRFGIWSGQARDAKKYLDKQIVIALEDDDEEDLSQTENIIKFLNTHSKYGKNVREIEEFGETLSSTLYKIVGSGDEVAIKVPKKIENQEQVAFFDIIYQTQLMQFLKDNRKDGEKQFFPSVHEEIFLVNKNTRTVLNYVTFVDFAQSSLINMFDGPTAGTRNTEQFDEEGFRSQEIFTPEKFAFLYYKGLILLEFLYDNGMTHGHINANSLRIDDDYTFTLSDFPISTVTPNFSSMSTQEQSEAKVQVRGFNKKTVSDDLRAKLISKGEEQKEDEHGGFAQQFLVSDLIREDWRDMVATFYFPRLGKMIGDQRVRQFVESTNRELLEDGQEAGQIKNIVSKAHRFIMSNIWILQDLIAQLNAEQMFEAVDSIGKEIYELGNRMENVRLQAFAQMTLGEIAATEHLEDPVRAEAGIQQLLQANELYQQDASILSTEEYSKVCLSLSTLYRSYKKDTSQAKRWLELAKDKITDKRVLLTFYTETANILSSENKHYQALDSNKKAFELAKQLYRDDDYVMFELQIALAEGYEKTDDHEQAEAVFNECFQQMDGRDGQSVYARGMSITSKLSKALSIKSKSTSIVMYGQRNSSKIIGDGGAAAQANQEKAGAMQRVAVQLRQKQEYGRAEKLMIKAISVKKQIVGSEVSEDIAYLYNELAVTYHGSDDYENASKCIKKQLSIWDALKKNNTLEYGQVLCFLGEIYRDMEMSAEAIDALDQGIRLLEKIAQEQSPAIANNSAVSGVPQVDQMALERTGIMMILAEEQIKGGQIVEGIKTAEGALFLQKTFFSNMVNMQVQETMLLLAEAYTVNKQATEALKLYQDILDARSDNFGAVAGEPTKDIYRKMAPLYTQLGNFLEAAESLKHVIEEETQEILKVGLLTKIAGNYKKASKKAECIQASKDAFELIKRLSGENDAQTCRCKINLAQVHQTFEDTDEAKRLYQEFITMYEGQTGAEGTQDWSQMDQYNKLKDFAQAAIEEIDGTGADEEEYYDEEGGEEGEEGDQE